MLTDARRRRFDVVVCWRLDRLGRNLKHLITLLEELQALGVAFVSLAEGIDATTPAGKLQMHILGGIAEFERERIRGYSEPRRRASGWVVPRRGRRSIVCRNLPGCRCMWRPSRSACPDRRSSAGAGRSNNPRQTSPHFRPGLTAVLGGRSGVQQSGVWRAEQIREHPAYVFAC
jgi:hypothetical protein